MGQTKVIFWGSNQQNLLSSTSCKVYNRPQHLTTAYDIIDLSATEKSVAFITRDGSVYTYGINMDGRLGVGGNANTKTIQNPVKVKLNARAVKVKCGFSHVIVQLINDDLYAWGLGEYGSLGIGELKSKSLPTRIIIKGKIDHFSCGAMHSGFVDSDGKIFTCGSNEYGELGVNKPEKVKTPGLVSFNQKVKQIECGVFYTLLLTNKGQVFGMGNNKYAQLGIGHKSNEHQPTIIRQLENIIMVAAGYHSGAIDSNGNLYIWGSGSFGEFLKPKKISLPTPVNYIFIRGFFGVAAETNRYQRVYSWGSNSYGELGCGNLESMKQPVQVSSLSNVKIDHFACGVSFFLATTKDDNLVQALSKEMLSQKKQKDEEGNLKNFNSKSKPATPKREEARYNFDELEESSNVKIEPQPKYARSSVKKNQFYQIYLTPAKAQGELRLKIKSERQARKNIEQQIQRSKNYEQLFICLSADYESLLSRYKNMEESMISKNRSESLQKDEYNESLRSQNDSLRQKNTTLKNNLNALRSERLSEDRESINQENEAMKKKVNALNNELSIAIEQLKRIENKKFSAETQRQIEELRTQNKKLVNEAKSIKLEFRKATSELQIMREQASNKDKLLSKLKQQKLSLERDLLEDRLNQGSSLEGSTNELRMLKEEIRTLTNKFEQAEEQIMNKTIEIKELKQKISSSIDDKSEIETMKQQLTNSAKDCKLAKEELKSTLRKYHQIEEQLAGRNLQVKEFKQKKQSIEIQLRQQIEDLNNEITSLNKQIKVGKEELKNVLRNNDISTEQLTQLREKKAIYDVNIEDLQSELQAQSAQIALLTKSNKSYKDELKIAIKKHEQIEDQNTKLKDTRSKLNSKEQELQNIKKENSTLLKDQKQIKESLKNTVKKMNILEMDANTYKQDLQRLENKLINKQQEIRKLQRKQAQFQQSQRSTDSKKDLQMQKYLQKFEQLQKQIAMFKQNQKVLMQSLKVTHQALEQKEKYLRQKEDLFVQMMSEHKNIQTDLYKEISALEEGKQKLDEINDTFLTEKEELIKRIKNGEQNFTKMQRQSQLELQEAYNKLAKMNEVHGLNQVRVSELRAIIDHDQQLKNQLLSVVNKCNLQIEGLKGEKIELFKMFEELKAERSNDSKIYQDQIIQSENQKAVLSQKNAELEIELNYQKDYHARNQFTIKDLTQSRDKAFEDKDTLKQDIEKLKKRINQLSLEVQRSKTFKRDAEVLSLQLQKMENSSKAFKSQIDQSLKEKQQIIKQLRKELDKKQKQIQDLTKNNDAQNATLNRQVLDWQKKFNQKNKECNETKKIVDHHVNEIDNLKELVDKNQRKLTFKNDELEKELKEHEKTTQQFNNLRREFTRLKSQTQELQHQNESNQNEKRSLQGKVAEKKKQIDLLQADIRSKQTICDNIRKQAELAKKELEQANWALEQNNRINAQLIRANNEFASGEEHYTQKIADLQNNIFEMEQQNKSYTPRYDSLMERNKELEQRNRDLSDMVNRAIEIQAETYKTNILKEVKFNTAEILQQIKEQQEYKCKGRRKEPASQENQISKIEIENLADSIEVQKTPKMVEQPYTKLMNQKISAHKKKLSESAQKLAGILSGKNQKTEIADFLSDGKEFARSVNVRREEDYEMVNNQMQSLSQKKNEFIQRITTFAEKLKIL